MPRRESLKNSICMCCQTNRCPNRRQIFCKQCFNFIHQKLGMDAQTISKKINQIYYTKVNRKCSFCDCKAVVSYKSYESNKKYYICRKHLDRWLKIGCQLGELSNFLHIDE